MRPLLSYRDAVALLGGGSALTDVLDKASSLALFGLGGIDLFDARAEAVRLGDGLIRRLRDQVKGLSRYDTTQRLAAAHAVIVISAYLEVLGEVGVLRELTREDQARLTGLGDGPLTSSLLSLPLPMPTPQHPHEAVIEALTDRYVWITESLVDLLGGLACWDDWDETERTRLIRDVPERALRRYEELFRRLVADFPEVACWSDLVGHQATRAEVRRLAQGLTGVQEQLSVIVSNRGPSDRLSALIQANRAALAAPIVAAADVSRGMDIPSLAQGYVDPAFRVLPAEDGLQVTSEQGWATLARRNDLAAFLSGHLTLPQATEAPLLVLGQPGAGKSVLTRVLAARLPAAEFLPIRVELRGVRADADVLEQIEHGIKDALDEKMSWPELVHAAQGALPVVVLDGFDELLQATGVNQTDYLEKVAQFQRRQAERGRALAVILTSRTAVADRARIPDKSIVLRLEPFDQDRVRQWVTIWNHGNQRFFQERGLEPLSVESVLTVPHLAEQPLLLLMLALYDADANAIRLVREEIHEADLYERLLHGFATREVRKSGDGRSDADLARAVEDELLRLSVTACAMFNRGLQWVREHDLESDLRALLPQTDQPAHGLRRALTRAEGVIGRFYFVHTTQALREEERLKTYEFLHATFGEYLVARLVVRELADMADELAFAASRHRPAKPDDAFLHACLSFASLAVRGSVVTFLEYGIRKHTPPDRRPLLTRHLCELFSGSLMSRPGSKYDGYQPVAAEAPTRYAAYSANLLLLAVLSSDEPIPSTDLFATDQPEKANELWRRISRLWHSQLTRAEWSALINTVRVRHFLRDGSRRMEAWLDGGEPFVLKDLVFFTWPEERVTDHPYDDLRITGDGPMATLMREIAFRDDTTLGHLFVDLLPYMMEVEETLEAHPTAPVADLLTIMLSADRQMPAYRNALRRWVPAGLYSAHVLRRLEADCHRLPADDVLELLDIAAKRWPDPNALERILRSLDGSPEVTPMAYEEMAERIASMKAQPPP
ncbi:NACHT domain-containing protein [Nonomuraea sp. 3N208]|uniref:NACHT domain-containing protein n=1 Tax=Nonomuraea sp. 3N208 TaxID=3457421 RepID=UPI003FCCC081